MSHSVSNTLGFRWYTARGLRHGDKPKTEFLVRLKCGVPVYILFRHFAIINVWEGSMAGTGGTLSCMGWWRYLGVISRCCRGNKRCLKFYCPCEVIVRVAGSGSRMVADDIVCAWNENAMLPNGIFLFEIQMEGGGITCIEMEKLNKVTTPSSKIFYNYSLIKT